MGAGLVPGRPAEHLTKGIGLPSRWFRAGLLRDEFG